MRHGILLFLGVLIAATSGTAMGKTIPSIQGSPPSRAVDYLNEVKPILDRRCVVCHSCYNSPCQLKLSSFEGLDRGATKQKVYSASRLTTADPTRLFTDAQSTAEWRRKGFFSVTENTLSEGRNDSIMMQLLSHKMSNPSSEGEYLPEDPDLTCAENQSELDDYLKKHPNRGMPFGFPPLEQSEFDIVSGWLVQGAQGPDPARQAALTSPHERDIPELKKWEAFLNRDDPKHAVTARYLYEHLFLAHLTFSTGTNEFFELVRSQTGPGEPIDLIATVRPYDDPGVDRVFYRFRKIHSTIVFKTHMVFELDEKAMKRFREIFIEREWLQEPYIPGYEPELSSNPFLVFEQIPPRSRYEFLLDHAHYIIMTFIRGPVCKGQVALNVIDDHFWVMFLDPDSDLSLRYPGFLKMHAELLRMPIEQGSSLGIFDALGNPYHRWAVEFYRERQDFYRAHYNYSGLGYQDIWRGNGSEDTPLLTVYRHFDSASVHKGVLGNLPKTMWVIDYPLMERIYYALVAGFDVYGNVGHQLSTRLYMDALRVEGETNFLDFLPPSQRKDIMQSWYGDTDLEDIHYYSAGLPAGEHFSTDNPKREFIESIVERHILPETGIAFGRVNYLRKGDTYPPLPERYESIDDYLRAFRAVARPGTSFFSVVNNRNANLAHVRIRRDNDEDLVISVVINRWHKNVTYLFGEGGALDPSKDEADFLQGFVGAYPNYYVDVSKKDLPDFLDLLENFDGSPGDISRLAKYGVNRADDNFWKVYDWFQDRFNRDDPVRAGLFDLNRYYYKAITGEQ